MPSGATTSVGEYNSYLILKVNANTTFRRHLNFVRDAFSGIPTLAKEHTAPKDFDDLHSLSDTLCVIVSIATSPLR
jgi:hypothetical protein